MVARVPKLIFLISPWRKSSLSSLNALGLNKTGPNPVRAQIRVYSIGGGVSDACTFPLRRVWCPRHDEQAFGGFIEGHLPAASMILGSVLPREDMSVEVERITGRLVLARSDGAAGLVPSHYRVAHGAARLPAVP